MSKPDLNARSRLPVVEILADLRDAGMSVEGLARHLGVGPRCINAWRRGENTPTPYARQRLTELHAHLDGWAVVAPTGGTS